MNFDQIGRAAESFRRATAHIERMTARIQRAVPKPPTVAVPRIASLDRPSSRDYRDLIDERDRYRDAVMHMLAMAPDEYRLCIIAARCSVSSENYAKNNGRAEMIRTFATGLAERAGLPVADWEQIKQGVPSDGVIRRG